jgi:hypothetical protein
MSTILPFPRSSKGTYDRLQSAYARALFLDLHASGLSLASCRWIAERLEEVDLRLSAARSKADAEAPYVP